MNAKAKFDAPILRNARVPFDHRVLHFDGTTDGIDNASKFDDRAITGALDDAPIVHSDRWINEVTAQGSESREDPILVRAGEAAEAHDVGHENRGQFPRFAHLRPRAGATYHNC